MDNKTNPPNIIAINKNIDTNPDTPDTAEKLENNCVVTPAIILAKIIREVPFVIPFSVIQSARNKIIIEPTAIINAANNTVVHEEVSINPPIRELIKNTIPIDCTNANGKVIYLI
jgi:hypothetical protein